MLTATEWTSEKKPSDFRETSSETGILDECYFVGTFVDLGFDWRPGFQKKENNNKQKRTQYYSTTDNTWHKWWHIGSNVAQIQQKYSSGTSNSHIVNCSAHVRFSVHNNLQSGWNQWPSPWLSCTFCTSPVFPNHSAGIPLKEIVKSRPLLSKVSIPSWTAAMENFIHMDFIFCSY